MALASPGLLLVNGQWLPVTSSPFPQLYVSLSLLTIGGNPSDKDPNEQEEREGNSEDDTVSRWTCSEDMHMTTEMTEDEVCDDKVTGSCPSCGHHHCYSTALSGKLPFDGWLILDRYISQILEHVGGFIHVHGQVVYVQEDWPW